MLNRRLADLVMVLHALIAVFFLFGSVAARFELWIGLIHFPLAAWVSTAYIMGWTCPLTPLENHYRKAAGEQGYEGSFIEHYLGRVFGFRAGDNGVHMPTPGERKAQIFLGIWFGIINLVLYCDILQDYHDAIWPLPVKPPGLVAGDGLSRDSAPISKASRLRILGLESITVCVSYTRSTSIATALPPPRQRVATP